MVFQAEGRSGENPEWSAGAGRIALARRFESRSAHDISVNPVTSGRPPWWTLAGCLVTKLRTGRSPRVLRAVRFAAEGRHRLAPVRLRGRVAVDPNAESLFLAAIVERRAVKSGRPPYDGLAESERGRLKQFLKILVNVTSYRVFTEINPNQGTRSKVRARAVGG